MGETKIREKLIRVCNDNRKRNPETSVKIVWQHLKFYLAQQRNLFIVSLCRHLNFRKETNEKLILNFFNK